MYNSIVKIQQLRNEKHTVLRNVYRSNNIDDVYNNQRELGAMSIGIFSDVASAIMPTLQDDGVSNIVWSNISLRLEKLSFISVPTAAEIREKYKKSVDKPTIINIDGEAPEPGRKTEVKRISLPSFLATLAVQGIAVPLILRAMGGSKLALVKILCVINAVCMIIEVVKYFDLLPGKNKKMPIQRAKEESTHRVDYEEMYRRAIQEVYRDNSKKLDDWFNVLETITTEEIDKELGKVRR